MKVALLILGPACELAGIVLVGSPDVFPQTERFGSWLAKRYGAFVNLILGLLRRPRSRAVEIGAADSVELADRMSITKSVKPGATVEEKIDFLLTRDQEAQRDVNLLRAALEDTEAAASKRVEALRAELVEHVAEELRRTHELLLPLRLTGIGLLVVGLAMVSIAAFL